MTIQIVVFILCVIAFNENNSRSLRIRKYLIHLLVAIYESKTIYLILYLYLASFIKPCKRDDPNINECLKKLFETLRPFSSRGMPEMHILPLDPIIIPSVTLNQGSGSMNFVALFTDLRGQGAKNYQVQKIK